MRLGLTQSLRTEQRLVQSPQMIQALQILQTPLLGLKDQIGQGMQGKGFLELKEDDSEEQTAAAATPALEDKLQREFAEQLDQLEQRLSPLPRNLGSGSGSAGSDEEDKKQNALNNTAGNGLSLPEHLLSQLRM